jgi:DNA-directed RNA polymerase specialized sigma24 family protein
VKGDEAAPPPCSWNRARPESDEPRRELRGDEAELFRSFHRQLVRNVRQLVNTSPDIVDDACNFAWAEFVRYQPDRERGWKSWLTVTAQREAWRLHAKEAAHDRWDPSEGVEPVDQRDVLGLRTDLRAALDLLAAVPRRRREVKALHVTGYTYVEIGKRLGLGHTRVNALIVEANAAIRKEHNRVGPDLQPRSDRATRMRELEAQPRKWLVNVIGRMPRDIERPHAMLAWRRAALAIDDYRRDHGTEFRDDGLGRRPADPSAGRAYDLACRAAARAQEARHAARARSLGR